jgi:arginyl-tRNA synthetase
MKIEQTIKQGIVNAMNELYNTDIDDSKIVLQGTRKEFDGDFTFVVFPFLRLSRRKPEQTAQEIGQFLTEKIHVVEKFNVIKGFLNIELSTEFWLNKFNQIQTSVNYGFVEPNSKKTVMIEYSSPNTNKPLHLGHIRNNLVGYSISEIIKAAGHKVVKVNLINDRGIHICKSMLAWQKWGKGETPESSGMKGDSLVGKYYVKYSQELKKEVEVLTASGVEKKEAEKKAPLNIAIQEMLKKWEAGDEATRELWKKMNLWVYKGFDVTYKNLGVDFDKVYYESETYLMGKEIVASGLKNNIFIKEDDSSVWCDLSNDGFDKKLLLRSDGTSVYITQDLGTAIQRFKEFDIEKLIYVVGNEQNYHFKVLFKILDKLGYSWANNLHHLSYGMVELPFGKMKSREGTVVDADELMTGMEKKAHEISQELGKLENYSDKQAKDTHRKIALAALKYFILKVDPKKNMLFNPDESIDFNGNTGPFIQYTSVRINSLLKKSGDINNIAKTETAIKLQNIELQLVKVLSLYPSIIKQSAELQNPSVIANYMYDLVKEYNHFYQQIPILKETDLKLRNFRLSLSKEISEVIKSGMNLLGIKLPEKM